MNGKLSMYKNLAWAIGIVACLIALVFGFFTAAFSRYGGERQVGGLALDQEEEPEVIAEPAVQSATGELISLPETADGGQAYLDSLTFLTDSTMIGLRDYGILNGGAGTLQVWATSAGNLPAANMATADIRYPNDGSQIPAVTAAMVAKPAKLVISVGSDSLQEVDRSAFIQAYTELIQGIQKNSPQTVIVCCGLCSVAPDYDGTDNLTAAMCAEANDWIRTVCTDTGVYFADPGELLRDSNGFLMSEYASANGKTLNSAGVTRVLDYLRAHTV
ncbi:MAG: SGNH/GDSL hydrolase family protein [Oscillospiraceae bacterium]|nr:SGNH/GDSL hydrolase family protein [Oscillospiraceae bacterium]